MVVASDVWCGLVGWVSVGVVRGTGCFKACAGCGERELSGIEVKRSRCGCKLLTLPGEIVRRLGQDTGYGMLLIIKVGEKFYILGTGGNKA